MKKILINKAINIIIFLVLVNTSIFSQIYDVRNCKWGMTIEEVRKTEGINPTSEKKEVISYKNGEYIYSDRIVATYDIVIDYKPVKMFYYFKNNILVSATMAIYWSKFYPISDHSISSRLNQFKNIFRNFITEKKFIADKFFITGVYYSDRILDSYRFCNSKETFKYYDNNDISRVATCVNSHFEKSNDMYWGLTMTNYKTNILIYFPSPKYQGDFPNEIIGWVSYESTNKVRSNDF